MIRTSKYLRYSFFITMVNEYKKKGSILVLIIDPEPDKHAGIRIRTKIPGLGSAPLHINWSFLKFVLSFQTIRRARKTKTNGGIPVKCQARTPLLNHTRGSIQVKNPYLTFAQSLEIGELILFRKKTGICCWKFALLFLKRAGVWLNS